MKLILRFFHIIADETKNQKGHIQILAQPEHALGNLLAMRGNTSNEIIIDHIICLDNKRRLHIQNQIIR